MTNRRILRLKDRWFTQTAWTIACIIPFLVLTNFVTSYGVNIPLLDAWALSPLFERVALANVSFQDFFAQHNEHRIVFPKLIFTALAFLTHWNVLCELYLSVFLIVLSYCLLYKISSRQAKKKDSNFWLTNLFISIVIISFVQIQNLLWGFQVAWFLITLCLIFSIFCLTYWVGSVWLKFGLGAVSCFIASFSSAHGLMTWLAVIPCVLILANEANQVQKKVQSKSFCVGLLCLRSPA